MLKRFKYIFISLLIPLAMASCYSEEEVPITQITCSKEVITPSYTSVRITCNFVTDFTIQQAMVYVSTTPDFSDAKSEIMSETSDNTYTATIADLVADTPYYIRYSVSNKWSTLLLGDTTEFRTLYYTPPTVALITISQVRLNSAVVGANVQKDGGHPVSERGICYSTSANPTIEHTKIVNGKGSGRYTCELIDLQEGTTYYVRAYAVNKKGLAYSKETSFTTPSKTYHNGYEFVDLGLSVKWATMNIGAKTPEEFGDYFAWGETSPKSVYDWTTYKYCNGTYFTLTKYNSYENDGVVDNKKVLELSDDAAHVNMGGDWRIPTYSELRELQEKCTWSWTTQNGVKGYKVSRGANEDNYIFLPAAGSMGGTTLYEAQSCGYYFSSTRTDVEPNSANTLRCLSNTIYWMWGDRSFGYPIRPVCP